MTDGDANQGRELLRSQYDGKSGLFYVELPDGTLLLHIIDSGEKFPAQFGREVCQRWSLIHFLVSDDNLLKQARN